MNCKYCTRYKWFSAGVLLLLGVFLIFSIPESRAYSPNDNGQVAKGKPEKLKDVGITEHVGRKLELDIPFKDENGQKVKLSQYVSGEKPVLLTIVYYECPMLCNYHFKGLTEALSDLEWKTGEEFEVVAVSMNHREGPRLARKKQQTYLDLYDRSGAEDGWHFLTGTKENIKALADQVGFSYRWDKEKEQYAHASAAYVLTPKGKIARYLYGIEFQPKTLRLSLVEASNGKVGNVVDQVLLYCFRYDPSKSKYTLYAYNLMKASAAVTVLVLAGFLIPAWLRERRKYRRKG